MDIRGVQKFSLIDYPGKIAAVFFTGGCNLRCGFCHNPCLVLDPESQPRFRDAELAHFLKKRRGLIEGLVISGGEPMLQPDLAAFIREAHRLGYLVKLDTNGTFPERLEALLAEAPPDALGIDFKTASSMYQDVTNTDMPDVAERVLRSFCLAVAHPEIALDVRTTVHRTLHSKETLEAMGRELASCGARAWMLQQFNPVEILDDDLRAETTYTDSELLALARHLTEMFDFPVRVRGLSGEVL